jgi:hypothetical protein
MAGSIHKVGKKFRVTYEQGIDNEGKRIRSYETVTTETDAKRLLNDFEYNQQRSLLVKSSDIGLTEFLEIWMSNYVKRNCEETTIYGYRNIMNKHVAPFIGNFKLQKLEPSHIQSYYSHLMDDKSLSPNTVHRHHAVLRKALDYALKQQYVYRNAADAVSLPKKKRFTGKTYTNVYVH